MGLRNRLVPAALLAACVPATEERDPRGAAGIVVEPSAASRGEPLLTDDGFSVRFETFAFLAAQRASAGGNDVSFAGSYEATAPRVWGSREAESFIPALAPGTYDVELQLRSLYLPASPRSEFDVPDVSEIDRSAGIDPATVQRFLQPADNVRPPWQVDAYSMNAGPTVIVVMRAERGGRTYRLDVALAAADGYADPSREGTHVDVRPNDVAFARREIHAERLLMSSSGGPMFGDLASADDDADGDGQVTPSELRAVKMKKQVCDPNDEAYSLNGANVEPPCPTLLDRLATRARSILVRP